jgi:hypothetical protein
MANDFSSFARLEHLVHEEGALQSAIVALGFGLAGGIEVWRFRDLDAEWFQVVKGGRSLAASYPDHQSAMLGALAALKAHAA